MNRPLQPRNIRFTSALSFIVLGSMAMGAGRPPSSVDELQGHWTAVSSVFHGKSFEVKQDLSAFQGKMFEVKEDLEFNGDRLIQTSVYQNQESRFTIDVTSMPAKLDKVIAPGTENERRLPGIFEVSETSLVMCFPHWNFQLPSPDPADRPKTLDSTPDNRKTRREYRRLGPAPAEGSSIAQLIEGNWEPIRSPQAGKVAKQLIPSEYFCEIKGGVIRERFKGVQEYKLTLHPGSERADLLRIGDDRIFRAIIEFDPIKKELKIGQNRSFVDDEYPADFTSTKDNHTAVAVYKKDEAKKP